MKPLKPMFGLLLIINCLELSGQTDNSVIGNKWVPDTNLEQGFTSKNNSYVVRSMKWQLSLSCAWNDIGINKNTLHSFDKSLSGIKSEDYPNVKAAIDFQGWKKWGIGVSLCSFEEVLTANRTVGSIDYPGYWFFFFYIPGYSETYQDNITITNNAKILNVYGIYKAIAYSEEKRCPWEITLRPGISVASITEDRRMAACIMQDSVDAQGYSFTYVKSTGLKDSFDRTSLSVFIGGQILLHYRKHFSFILADVKETVGLINATVPESTIIVENTKKLSIKKHKLSDSGFSIALGIAIHF